jgi:hypothetical protein
MTTLVAYTASHHCTATIAPPSGLRRCRRRTTTNRYAGDYTSCSRRPVPPRPRGGGVSERTRS